MSNTQALHRNTEAIYAVLPGVFGSGDWVSRVFPATMGLGANGNVGDFNHGNNWQAHRLGAF